MKQELFTFKELKDMFNWDITRDICKPEQIRYANCHRLDIEFIKKEKGSNFYKIRNTPEYTFTKQEILNQYGWTGQAPDLIKYAKNRGVILKQLNFSKRPIYYEILDDKISRFEWKVYPVLPKIEVAKEGYIRNIDTKALLGTKTTHGYMQYTDTINHKTYMLHRIVLETFNPTENMNDLFVDHIDGNRQNNNVTNLRWVSHQENMDFKVQNWQNIDKLLGKIIQKVGYEKTYQYLIDIFEKI